MLFTSLSQTATPSRTPSPSSVTYFMDGPYSSRASDEPYVPTMCRTGELCKWSPTPHPIPRPAARKIN